MQVATLFRNLVVGGVSLILAACGAASADRSGDGVQRVIDEIGAPTARNLAQLEQRLGPAGLTLAGRFDPAVHTDYWGRPTAWALLDLRKAPTLPWGDLSAADAAAVNALLPADDAGFAPAKPFFLRASGAERDRAVLCMTQAIYYEAALQPLGGQQAVAQTVINRLRHPDFPKSVCGVVYEGSELPIGCQFSFTCDGSLARPPIEPYWSRAKEVAEAALDGFVAADIGPATHYHADYVFPRWGPQMVKIVQLGAHIFYRYPGPVGDPSVLTGRYAGNELKVSMTGPSPDAIAAAKAALASGKLTLADLAAAPVPPTLTPPPTGKPAQFAASAPGAARPAAAIAPLLAAAPGDLVAGRRIPTKQQIARVNAQLPPVDDPDAPIATARP
ncbi:MAG TPA: cell wall hydrolase [Caulobacteraceae bacterium]|jgi:spore germination cell wall hydrolase CwlJ-like protein